MVHAFFASLCSMSALFLSRQLAQPHNKYCSSLMQIHLQNVQFHNIYRTQIILILCFENLYFVHLFIKCIECQELKGLDTSFYHILDLSIAYPRHYWIKGLIKQMANKFKLNMKNVKCK